MVLVWPRIWPETTDDRAELAHGAGIAEQHAVEQRPSDVGQRHRPERLPAGGAERQRRLLVAVPCSCISGISSRATKGKVTKIVASTMPGTAKMISMPWRFEPWPEPALRAEQQHDRPGPTTTGETENGRSISVIRKALALEVELGDRPGGGDAEDEVERHGDGRDEQRQPDRGERVGIAEGRRDRRRRPCANASANTGDQRQRQEQRQERDEPRCDQDDARQRALARWRARSRLDGQWCRDAIASAMAEPPPAPGLDQVDHQKHDEGDRPA